MKTQEENAIRKMFDQFSKENGGLEPIYADCTIQWLDTNETEDVTIKLFESTDEDSDEDQHIFYYCRGCNDIISLTEVGCEDFIIKRVNELSLTLI